MRAWIVLALLAAPGADPQVRLDADGVRIGHTPLRDAVLRLERIEAGLVLVSASCVEPLAAPVTVGAASGNALELDPGVRASREGASIRLASPAGRALVLHAGGLPRAFPGPVVVTPEPGGWRLPEGERVAQRVLRARLQAPQENPDADLQRMREAARRIQTRDGVRSSRQRLVFGVNPTALSELAEGQSLRMLDQVTPTGSP
jgi:hypothetical protein